MTFRINLIPKAKHRRRGWSVTLHEQAPTREIAVERAAGRAEKMVGFPFIESDMGSKNG